jgi:hypothetical protein
VSSFFLDEATPMQAAIEAAAAAAAHASRLLRPIGITVARGLSEQTERSSHLRFGFVVRPCSIGEILIRQPSQPVLLSFASRVIETQFYVFRQCITWRLKSLKTDLKMARITRQGSSQRLLDNNASALGRVFLRLLANGRPP